VGEKIIIIIIQFAMCRGHLDHAKTRSAKHATNKKKTSRYLREKAPRIKSTLKGKT